MIFTPEFVNEGHREIILVSNHSLQTEEAIQMSVEFNLARVRFGKQHLPGGDWRVRLLYDVRGQNLNGAALDGVAAALAGSATVEFKL
ncbi:MAG: hypothetical protein Q8N10_01595 [Phenylobacterium sp.]|uniref:hypothetical protein n=1 Tax=Phenylobacterium sp. TaxID=1871053 RepID=UPI002718C6BF|nr:hypothetical protein [Phenylobacterium sp.]MDO8911240.1 hypothetical protein [Phenylobacterium sp.]MDP3099175.1 hypothetical protein [Phenylobacterium sp.]